MADQAHEIPLSSFSMASSSAGEHRIGVAAGEHISQSGGDDNVVSRRLADRARLSTAILSAALALRPEDSEFAGQGRAAGGELQCWPWRQQAGDTGSS
ncbi:protein of unknown function (plasmid) [Methylocella tundrae]|uniref:Uncharacterized protein n=1 Tax=Methylocella tundrae TaxID=227605 RepID=A0A4U8Z6V0_METTU|nr:hypothetical protein [Methylocella tundrae]VFU16541.1 protein of unknown function [Methylocella tundrae]